VSYSRSQQLSKKEAKLLFSYSSVSHYQGYFSARNFKKEAEFLGDETPQMKTKLLILKKKVLLYNEYFFISPCKETPQKSAPFLGIFATPSSPKKLYPPLSPPKHL